MTIRKDFWVNILLPAITLFMFLFNIVWSTPISILSKAFTISEYLIFNNMFVWISVAISVVVGIFFYLIRNQKLHQIFIIVLYAVILLATLYLFVLPYFYGVFEENYNLAPRLSLTGFSKWYYLLDVALILVSSTLVYLSIKKEVLLIPLILLFFYSYENITSVSSLNISQDMNGATGKNIVFSTNHKNVLLFISDAVSAIDIDYMIKHIWTKEEKAWLNDFTFYNETITLGMTCTKLSLPSMLGGYNYAPQFQISEIIKNNITTKHERATNLKYTKHTGLGTTYFFVNDGLKNLDKIIDNKVVIKYDYIGKSELCTGKEEESQIQFLKSPILAVSLYSRVPYFLRSLLTDNGGKAWEDKLSFAYKWVKYNNSYKVLYQETEKPVINIIHTWGGHVPFYPLVKENTPENYIVNMNAALSYSLGSLKRIITNLQQRGIYNSTKIILASDHGHSYSGIKHYPDDELNKLYPLIEDTTERNQLPMLLVKNFNETNTRLRYDDRLLSLADIHAIMVSAFTNVPTVRDYTIGAPVQREFNYPFGSGSFVTYFMDKEVSSSFVREHYHQTLPDNTTNGELKYIKYRSKTNLEILSTPFDKLDQLMPYTVIN